MIELVTLPPASSPHPSYPRNPNATAMQGEQQRACPEARTDDTGAA